MKRGVSSDFQNEERVWASMICVFGAIRLAKVKEEWGVLLLCTRRTQEVEAANHVVPRRQDGRGSTRESLGDQKLQFETRNSSHGNACASVAS